MALAVILLPLFALLLAPLPRERLHPPASTRVLDRRGQTLRVYAATDDHYCLPIQLNQASPFLTASTVAFEDRWFRWHPGFNPVAIVRAARMNLRAGKILSGGSTITQQVARLMEPRPRSFRVKAVEAFRALQLELFYSKDDILTFYLNLAPYGGNIRGAGAASWIYFGKQPSALGPGEAALLASLPNSPTRLRPDLHPEAARARRDDILSRMLARGDITREQRDLSRREAVPTRRRPFPLTAPHFCDYLHYTADRRPGDRRSTLDATMQETGRRLLDRHLQTLRSHGVNQGAVVVIQNDSNAVRVWVGSGDYFDETDAGQVNGPLAPRSPGSALKPFAYALALDAGVLTPLSRIADVPVDYAGYAPVNYDERFHGLVTVEYALMNSLNVPAVNTVAQVGFGRLHGLLKRGGFTTLDQPPEYYGLQLVLGGVGARLIELTNLYATLARGGRYRPYRVSEDQPLAPEDSLLSPGACYIVTDVLSRIHRPDFPSFWEYSPHLPTVAWKTGTSYGHRDAWSVGCNPRWTVGVWIGNFSGEGSPVLVGAEAATPLLFDVFSQIEPAGGSWFETPDGVSKRKVCAISGQTPGPWCDATREELYLPNRSPQAVCSMHQRILIDDSTGCRLCPNCRAGLDYHVEIVVQYPPEVVNWMIANGQNLSRIPPHNPKCVSLAQGIAPSITSPAEDCQYRLRPDAPVEYQKIRLQAAVDAGVKTVYWFVDGTLLYKGAPGGPLFLLPKLGRHEIICLDDEGRRAARVVEVVGN